MRALEIGGGCGEEVEVGDKKTMGELQRYIVVILLSKLAA